MYLYMYMFIVHNQCLDEWCRALRENLRGRQGQLRRMLHSGDASVCSRHRATRCAFLCHFFVLFFYGKPWCIMEINT